MAVIEHTLPNNENAGNHCPMLDNPQAYDAFSMNIQGRDVTVIPAEFLEQVPTDYVQGCIEKDVPAIPCTFACSVCRRYGAVGN